MLNKEFEAENWNGAHLRSKVGVSGAVAPWKRSVGEVRKLGVVALSGKVAAIAQSWPGPQAALPDAPPKFMARFCQFGNKLSIRSR